MRSMTAIFHQEAAGWSWMVSAVLAVVLTACVGETTSSTFATSIETSTSIEAVTSSVATSIAPSTTVEAVSPTVDTGPYEAVFLRLVVVDDMHEGPVLGSKATVVVAVSVNHQGEEREIARLPGAWVAYWPPSGEAYLRPLGAVSPTGLLAIPSEHAGSDPLMLQWEIFDLLRPEEGPVIIDGVREHVESVGSTPYYPRDLGSAAFWGPGERLAIVWGPSNTFLSFVEGRTGAMTTIPRLGDIAPAWAADGSGVFLSGGEILRPDGTQADSATAIREDSCKRQFESGAAISLPSAVGESPLACVAPDDSMIVFNQKNTYFQSRSGVLAPGADTWVEIDGSFAGWLKVDP